ncbi:MAG: TOMM precursor leader peptide-binding protein [Haloechinothrix sp.]
MNQRPHSAQPPIDLRLPRRPRLIFGIGAFQRTRTEVQVGLDPRHAVVIRDLPAKLARMLCSLDGTARLPALLDRVGSDHADLLRGLLAELTGRGLIDDAADFAARNGPADAGLLALRAGAPPDAVSARLSHAAVVVHGEGRLAVTVAMLLAGAGIGRVIPEAAGTVTEPEAGCGFLHGDVGHPRRHAMIEAIGRANPATRTRPLIADRNPDLVVLTDSVVPTPELVSGLMCEQLPHLPVRVRDGIGIVGPLILPGRTSCLHCADLYRAGFDRCWPRVANQLAGRRGLADPSSTQATAALAVGQILRTVVDLRSRSPLWNSTLEIDVHHGTLRHRPWSPHPRCGCEAACA